MRSLMRGRVVFDGRNILDQELLTTLGFDYMSFGHSGTARANGHMPELPMAGELDRIGAKRW